MLRILILAFLGFTSWPLRGQTVEGLVNIRFQLDARVFATMAALNAGGFDADADALGENPARRIVRERLAKLEPDLMARLKKFCTSQDPTLDPLRQQGKYISFSLALTHPPSFDLAVKPEDVPAEARTLVGFEKLIQQLWEKAELARVWEEVRPHYIRASEEYRPLIRRTIIEALRYMRTEARIALDRQVIFIPDLLNAYGVVNARNVGDDYYLVVGPSRGAPRSTRGVRHEYLHFMIDPLVRKYTGYLPEPEPFLKLARARSRLQPRYRDDFSLLLTESLIHAVEFRLEALPYEDRVLRTAAEYEEGMILEPYFNEALERFETGRMSFQEFFPVIIDGITLEKVKGRAEELSALQQEILARKEQSQSEREALARARAEERGVLIEANRHLLERRFDEARTLLEKVLEKNPQSPQALYGLAQIAGQQQDLDRALELYEKAAEGAGEESWIAGWSYVRRGNIYQFRGEISRARTEWEKVRALKGNLRGAAEAASRALDSTPQR